MDKDKDTSSSPDQVNSHPNEREPPIYMLHPDAFPHWTMDAQVLMASCRERFKGFERWLKARQDEGIFRQSWDARIVNCLLDEGNTKAPEGTFGGEANAVECNCITDSTKTRAAEKIIEKALLSYRKLEADLEEKLKNIFPAMETYKTKPLVNPYISKAKGQTDFESWTIDSLMACCNAHITETETLVERLDRFSFLFDLARQATHAQGALRDRSAHIDKMWKATEQKIADLTRDCEKFQIWKELFDKKSAADSQPNNVESNSNSDDAVLNSWESQLNPFKDGVTVGKHDNTKALLKALQMVEADFLTHAGVHIKTLKGVLVTIQRCREEIQKAKAYYDFFLSTKETDSKGSHWHLSAMDMNSFEVKFVKGVVERWQDEDEKYYEDISFINIETQTLAEKRKYLIKWIAENLRFLRSRVDSCKKRAKESQKDLKNVRSRMEAFLEDERKITYDDDDSADEKLSDGMKSLKKFYEVLLSIEGTAVNNLESFEKLKASEGSLQIGKLSSQSCDVLEKFASMSAHDIKAAANYATQSVDTIQHFMDNHSSFTVWISRFQEILKCVGKLFSTWRKNKSLQAKSTELLLLQTKREAEKAEMEKKLRASHAEEARLLALMATLESEKTKKKKEIKRNKKRNDKLKRSPEVAQVDGKDGITYDTDENIGSEEATCGDSDADALVSEVGRENAGSADEGDLCGEGKITNLGDTATKSTRKEDDIQEVASTDYPLRTCAWQDCVAMETTPKQFQICARCKKMKSRPSNYYCGVECQTQDWNTKHRQFHVEESRQLKELKKREKEVKKREKEVGDMIKVE